MRLVSSRGSASRSNNQSLYLNDGSLLQVDPQSLHAVSLPHKSLSFSSGSCNVGHALSAAQACSDSRPTKVSCHGTTFDAAAIKVMGHSYSSANFQLSELCCTRLPAGASASVLAAAVLTAKFIRVPLPPSERSPVNA